MLHQNIRNCQYFDCSFTGSCLRRSVYSSMHCPTEFWRIAYTQTQSSVKSIRKWNMIWLDVCTCSVWRGQLLSPDWFSHRDVRCLFEVGRQNSAWTSKPICAYMTMEIPTSNKHRTSRWENQSGDSNWPRHTEHVQTSNAF
jgi:hypothetical protein